MRKPIFESEEELKNFIDDCIFIDEESNSIQNIIDCARIGNWIKRSPVEEAEEMYNEKFQEHRQTFLEVKQNEAIQYLKKQLEEK